MNKFDVVVGNPPYQKNAMGKNKNTLIPIYPDFMDVAEILSNIYVFITPARWIFNTGRTPKDWNEKMLNDQHINVIWYPEDSKTFKNVGIRGGVVITERNTNKQAGLNGMFIRNPLLKTILTKVEKIEKSKKYLSISDIILRGYKLNKDSKGKKYKLDTNAFIKFPELFKEDQTENTYEILGLEDLKRVVKFIDKDKVAYTSYIDKFNVLYPKASGSGQFGEFLAPFSIGKPNTITTNTFLNIGEFETMTESLNCIKYLNTRFSRALLSILKPTHQNNINTWSLIPVQNFTETSDINWNENIENIDKQLFKKYKLNKKEIEYLETINYRNKDGFKLL